jgi:hypothetical protein
MMDGGRRGEEMNSDDDDVNGDDEMDDSSGEDGDDNDNVGSDYEEINYEIVEKFIRTFHNGDLDQGNNYGDKTACARENDLLRIAFPA